MQERSGADRRGEGSGAGAQAKPDAPEPVQAREHGAPPMPFDLDALRVHRNVEHPTGQAERQEC
jgi:hypothetical protein